MKQLTILASTLAFIIAASASAEIREITKMKDALRDIQAGDAVVFDIDNTILQPVQTLGSDQWFDQMVERRKQNGLDTEQAVERTSLDWEKVQHATDVRLVESRTARQIRKLQFRGIVTVALTARPDRVKDTTYDQLKALGVRFDQFGVIFANGKNKGLLLKEFLERNNLHPRRLIFIDDKAKNVKNVDDVFKDSAIPNINYRYGAADRWVQNFYFPIADIQWSHFVNFGYLITDDQARDLLDSHRLAH